MPAQGPRAAEALADKALTCLLEQPKPPATLDLKPILSNVPHKLWTTPPKPHGYIVLGLSPRATNCITSSSNLLANFTKLLTSFVIAHFLKLPFCSIAVRVGGKLQVHCDTSVSGLSVVFSGTGTKSCGFWTSDRLGNDFEEFQGSFVPGTEFDLVRGPLQFDARRPHCGRSPGSAYRLSVAVFQLKRRTPPKPEILSRLLELGFQCEPFPLFDSPSLVSTESNHHNGQLTLRESFTRVRHRTPPSSHELEALGQIDLTDSDLDLDHDPEAFKQAARVPQKEDNLRELVQSDGDDDVIVADDSELASSVSGQMGGGRVRLLT